MELVANQTSIKTPRTSAFVFGTVYLSFAGCLLYSPSYLPSLVASHFDAGGRPDGWMDSASYISFIAIFGTVFPLIVPALVFFSRFLPNDLQNLPNRDYWLAPQRRQQTMAALFQRSLWVGALATSFIMGLHFLVIFANRAEPVAIPVFAIIGLTAYFVIGIGFWVISLFRYFKNAVRREDATSASSPARS